MNTMANGSVVEAGHTWDAFHRALRGYLATVATALGIGLESCTLDVDTPVSAYLAVDQKVAAFPDRDAAVLWDEENGWSVAMETHSGEDLIVLAYLHADTVVVPADLVVAFVERACAGLEDNVRPPAIRTRGAHHELVAALAAPDPSLSDVA